MQNAIQKTRRAAIGSALIGVNFLALPAAVTSQETVTVGSKTWEVDTEGSSAFLTSGNIAVDLSGGSTVASQGTLTIAEPLTIDDDMTIGATVYVFKAGATAAAGEIGIGADEAATKIAIVAAINGTDGFNTANASVSASAFAGDVTTLTALEPGTVGDAVATTEAPTGLTHASNIFNAVTLGTTTAGVDPTAGEAITAFAAALLADEGLDAYAQTGGIAIVNRTGRENLACTETLAGASNAWQNAVTSFYADDPTEYALAAIQSRAAVAAEVTAGLMHFAFARPVIHALVQVVDSSGVNQAWVGGRVLNGNLVTVDNTGGTDFADTDVVTVVAGFAPQA